MSKQYEYLTGNLECMQRIKSGENPTEALNNVGQKWTPGNEYLWDDYDIESLINTPQKKSIFVNSLLYNRIKKYRELLEQGIDIKGKYPFSYNTN
tara:strand:- start:429 stop:713 length:285 start_codon:yes stop_codon:yes gene_type:complete